MFPSVTIARRHLAETCAGLDAASVTPATAAGLIDELSRIERLAAGARLLLAGCIDESVAGAEGEQGPARWLARHTGRSVAEATRELEAVAAIEGLPATEAAVRAGELTPVQVHEVTSAAAVDPAAEADLLATAREATLSELRRQAKRVRAAATDTEDKARGAHERRDLSSSTDEETGEGDLRAKGPAATVAQMLALLEPWVQARFAHARCQGRRERRGALAFDALLDALRYAGAARRGDTSAAGADPTDLTVPTGPPAQVLARVDAAALRRGHTVAGEVCEIDGLGPVAVEDLRRLLPQAAIDLVLTDGVDVFNVTHFGRRTNARQQVVMDWIGGECARLGCTATRHLQVDHRIDWAKVRVTELVNLDWLCPADHHRKTNQGWALVPGRGRRPMVPPDHPAHPANAPPVAGPTALERRSA